MTDILDKIFLKSTKIHRIFRSNLLKFYKNFRHLKFFYRKFSKISRKINTFKFKFADDSYLIFILATAVILV